MGLMMGIAMNVPWEKKDAKTFRGHSVGDSFRPKHVVPTHMLPLHVKWPYRPSQLSSKLTVAWEHTRCELSWFVFSLADRLTVISSFQNSISSCDQCQTLIDVPKSLTLISNKLQETLPHGCNLAEHWHHVHHIGEVEQLWTRGLFYEKIHKATVHSIHKRHVLVSTYKYTKP